MNTRTIVYFFGTLVLLAGIGLVANLLGVPTPWIIAGSVIVLGLGIMAATNKMRSGYR